jgi:hypothetical protein
MSLRNDDIEFATEMQWLIGALAKGLTIATLGAILLATGLMWAGVIG